MTITVVLSLLAILGLAGVGGYAYVRRALTRQFDDSLLTKANSLHLLLRQERRSATGKVEFDFADNAMPEFDKGGTAEYFELWTADRKVIERSNSLGQNDLSLPAGAAGITPQFDDVQLPDGRRARSVILSVLPIRDDHDEDAPRGQNGPDKAAASPHFWLAVARERGTLDGTLATIAIAATSGLAALALLFGGMIPWLIAKNLRPLQEMAERANQIGVHSLDTRFPVTGMPDELRPICERLNDSMDRLQAAFVRERRFSADVAHELRTPIAELRLLSELAVKFPADAQSNARAFQDAHDIARQMGHIVETLLLMISGQSAPVDEVLEPTDLGAVAEQAYRAHVPVAEEKSIRWESNAGALGPVVRSNVTIVRQLFSNLISNAVEYSPAGSLIRLKVDKQGETTVVNLFNPTQALVESDLQHLAEPFWRKDSSRTGGRHAGLGLPLVVSYAKRLGVSVAWKLPEPGMFQVTLVFPTISAHQNNS